MSIFSQSLPEPPDQLPVPTQYAFIPTVPSNALYGRNDEDSKLDADVTYGDGESFAVMFVGAKFTVPGAPADSPTHKYMG